MNLIVNSEEVIECVAKLDMVDEILDRTGYTTIKKIRNIQELFKGMENPPSASDVSYFATVKSGERFRVKGELVTNDDGTCDSGDIRARCVMSCLGEMWMTTYMQLLFIFFKKLFPTSFI